MRGTLLTCSLALFSTAAVAQTPPVAAAAVTLAVAQDAYSYQTDGRRDPFVTLISSGADAAPLKRGEGLAAFGVGEISVRGIMQSHDRLVAMVQGPDNKTYVIHAGDKLADGVVKNVTPQGLIVVQDITDPLSIQKQREVRKLLRSLEEAKE